VYIGLPSQASHATTSPRHRLYPPNRPTQAWKVVTDLTWSWPRRRYRQSVVASSSSRRPHSVALATISLDNNCVQLFRHWQRRRSLHAASTTVIRCCMACLTTSCRNAILTERWRTSNYWNWAMQTHNSSPAEVALTSCSFTSSRVQTRRGTKIRFCCRFPHGAAPRPVWIPLKSLAGQHQRIWLPTFSSLLTMAALSFGPHLKGYVSFHAHATVSATEVFLLPVLVCGTPCRHICDKTRATDISSSHWNDTCLGCRWPWRIVTVVFVRLRSPLTYLLTNTGSQHILH